MKNMNKLGSHSLSNPTHDSGEILRVHASPNKTETILGGSPELQWHCGEATAESYLIVPEISAVSREGHQGHHIQIQWYNPFITHRIHGAAIYGNIYHQYTPPMLAYIPYMDPMGHGYF